MTTYLIEVDKLLIPALLSLLRLSPVIYAGELAGHKFLITSVRTGETEIFLMNPDTGDAINLTRSPDSEERYPCFSPDGRQVAFTSNRNGTYNLYVMNIDGSNHRQLTYGTNKMGAVYPNFSPDGKKIVYANQVGEALEQFICDANGCNVRQLTHLSMITCPAAWSPDGKWISMRVTDNAFWRDKELMEKTYREKRGDKRPVWIIRPDGSNPHVVETLRYQCAIDGSRPAWKPE